MTDKQYMMRCLALARLGEYYVAPNPMVGAVLVSSDGRILAEGWHRQYGGPHAEVNCFMDADAKGVSAEETHDATLYVSLEPCSHYGKTPPCADLIIRRRPGRVVCGMFDPNPQVAGRGAKKIEEAGIEVVTGVCEAECRFLNRRFLMLHEHHRPYIILKWAQTADGYIDNRAGSCKTAIGGEALNISTALTKQLVHKMRAENMAIMVGSGTVLADNPHLTVKHWSGRNPVRVVLDRRGRIPEDARVMVDAAEPSDYMALPRTMVWRNAALPLEWMADKGIHSVLVEGGTEVLSSLMRDGWYDEIHVEVNPRLFVGEGTPAPALPDSMQPLEQHKAEVFDGNMLYTFFRQGV